MHIYRTNSITIENDDDDGFSSCTADAVSTMMVTRVEAGLVIGDRKTHRRKGRTVSLLRAHTGKEQNRTLLTFEQ